MADETRTAAEPLLTAHRSGFPPGYTAITREGEPGRDVGLDFGIHVLQRGESLDTTSPKESAWVLLDGLATVLIGGRDRAGRGATQGEVAVERRSLFDAAPTTVHLAPGARLRLRAQSQRVEWAVAAASNDLSFPAQIFWPAEVEPEYRGLGLAQGTCVRNVRLVFDRRSRPESNLVVGEVVNYPGRWSSYPPHHHAQPEIYHYRFSAPQGYGHGEVGERVYKLRQYDTLCIPALHDHAQVAAPGYAMYYLWVVRHLEANPYTGFEYTPEHAWMLDPGAVIWAPRDGLLASGAAPGAGAAPAPGADGATPASGAAPTAGTPPGPRSEAGA